MTLLEALNAVLRSVGESPVQNITTNHPEQRAILAELENQNKRRQSRGWWFNQYIADLPSATLPVGTVAVRPENLSLDYYVQNGQMYNRRTGSPVTGATPDVEVQRLVDFIDLPAEFADYVVVATSLAYGTNFDEDELHLQALQAQLQDAEVLVHRMHIRHYVLHRVNKRLQGRGWWFNTFIRHLSTVDAQGLVIPKSYLFVRPTRRDLDYFPRNGRMIDRHTGLTVTHAIDAEVREFIDDYSELPQSFQDYVAAVAELERAQDFLPSSSSIQRLEDNMERARQNAQQDHIKYARVNLFATPSTGSSISRAWGYRYRNY